MTNAIETITSAPLWTAKAGYMERTDASQILNDPDVGAWVRASDHLAAITAAQGIQLASAQAGKDLAKAMMRIEKATPVSTNSATAAEMSSWTYAVASTALESFLGVIGDAEKPKAAPDCVRQLAQFAAAYRGRERGVELDRQAVENLIASIDQIIPALAYGVAIGKYAE